MRWPSWPGRRDDSKDDAEPPASAAGASPSPPASSSSSFADYPAVKQFISWTDSLNKTDWQHYNDPQTWLPPALAVGAALGFSAFYRSYLRRIPGTNHIQPRFFRRRSLLGKVTSVGDGDNFHLFHTPGGRLAGWGWLRKVPSYRKDLKGKTIPVRIAGIDAPEGAHFGRPAQPYSGEALDFLTHYLLGRRVRAYLYRRDQYDRVVARVLVRRFFFFKRDVGLEMLKRGLATCYEAKTGAEFGGREAQYRVAEARAKARKRGLWAGGPGKGGSGSGSGSVADIETPREYKTRMAALDSEKAAAAAGGGAGTSSTAGATASTASTTSTASKSAAASSTTASASAPPVAAAAKPAAATPPSAAPAAPPKAAPAASPSSAGGGKASGWGKGPLPGGRR